MAGIDNMLGHYVKQSLENQLGKKITSKIEQELYYWYKINLDQAVIQFDKLDRILSSIYGKKSSKAIERKLLKAIIQTKPEKPGLTSIVFNESELIQSTLSIIEDASSRKILDTISENNGTSIENILNISNLDLSGQSAYRKIDALIKKGLIVETGYVMGNKGRKVKTYKKIFEKINIKMNHKLEMVMTVNNDDIIKTSLILQTICI